LFALATTGIRYALSVSEPLEGASVVVIGGSSGIGLATARMARAAGARVTIAGRDPARLEAARVSADVDAVATDVSDEDQVRALFEQVGHVDHVAVLSGAAVSGLITETETAALRVPMEVRFWGSVYVAKHASPRMDTGGSITLTSGVIVERPMAGRVLGTATTAATEGLSRALAVELAPIRVNTVRPGLVDTPMILRNVGDRREEFLAAQAERLPVRRFGTPEDLADAFLFLMRNRYVTGITLTVDGGHLLL
jgi:NAD(P)-dependent dehydrogenase (short-subunit alcohol dehydrogenase family)